MHLVSDWQVLFCQLCARFGVQVSQVLLLWSVLHLTSFVALFIMLTVPQLLLTVHQHRYSILHPHCSSASTITPSLDHPQTSIIGPSLHLWHHNYTIISPNLHLHRTTTNSTTPFWHVYVLGGVEKRKVATSWRHRIQYWYVYDVTWCLSSGTFSKR